MYTLKYMIRIKRNDIIFRDYKNKLHLIAYNDNIINHVIIYNISHVKWLYTEITINCRKQVKFMS